MARWFYLMCLGVLALAGTATAQPDSTDKSFQPTRSPGSDENVDLLVMRTAGQKERHLRMVKPGPVEADDLVEVKDVLSGNVFSIPGQVFLRLPKLKNENVRPEVPIPTKQVEDPRPLPVMTDEQPRPEPQRIQTAGVPQQMPETRLTALPPAPVALQRTPTLSAESWRAAPVPVYSNEDRWKSASTPYQPQARVSVLPPVGTPFELTPQETPAPTTTIRGQAPGDDRGFVRITPQVIEERQPAAELEMVAYSGERRRTIQELMQAETKDYIYDLATAIRPSQREYAASGLAACRFASRPEVKNVLAKAAISDPAPSVRAHCVLLLSRLGYHEPEYIEYLKTCEKSDHPMLRVAANFALSGLSPKK
jgi:hypothetical protein